LRLLIFSDIHNDWKTLEKLLDTEADYYIAAGDQVTWAKGLERCGEILQRRGDKVYVLRATTNRPTRCQYVRAVWMHNFHERHFQVGQWQVAGLGYSNPTPSTPPANIARPN